MENRSYTIHYIIIIEEMFLCILPHFRGAIARVCLLSTVLWPLLELRHRWLESIFKLILVKHCSFEKLWIVLLYNQYLDHLTCCELHINSHPTN